MSIQQTKQIANSLLRTTLLFFVFNEDKKGPSPESKVKETFVSTSVFRRTGSSASALKTQGRKRSIAPRREQDWVDDKQATSMSYHCLPRNESRLCVVLLHTFSTPDSITVFISSADTSQQHIHRQWLPSSSGSNRWSIGSRRELSEGVKSSSPEIEFPDDWEAWSDWSWPSCLRFMEFQKPTWTAVQTPHSTNTPN